MHDSCVIIQQGRRSRQRSVHHAGGSIATADNSAGHYRCDQLLVLMPGACCARGHIHVLSGTPKGRYMVS